MKLKHPISIVVIALLSACASDDYFTREQLAGIKPGMSAADLVEAMGEPVAKQQDEMGGDVWIYDGTHRASMLDDDAKPCRVRVTLMDGRVVTRVIEDRPVSGS